MTDEKNVEHNGKNSAIVLPEPQLIEIRKSEIVEHPVNKEQLKKIFGGRY